MSDLYVYRISRLERVVDGDTVDLVLDAGFHLTFASRFRLNGIDCPETRRGSEFERAKGAEATQAAVEWFARHAPLDRLRVRTHKDDSFGRWLADVYVCGEDEDLGQHLLGLGLAAAWPTRWRDQHDRTEEA